jgi:hypothetical protein
VVPSPYGQSWSVRSLTSAPHSTSAATRSGWGGGEQHRQRAALRLPEQDGAVRPGCVHDRAHVVHPLLQRARLNPVRQPHAPLVKQDQPCEGGQLLTEPPERRQFPHHIQVGKRALHIDQIVRSVTERPVGDMHGPAPGIAGLRPVHTHQRAPGGKRTQPPTSGASAARRPPRHALSRSHGARPRSDSPETAPS